MSTLSESNPADRRNRWFWLGVLLIAGLVSFPFLEFGFMVFKPVVSAYFRRIPFDSATWQDEKRVYSDEAVRQRMLPSLLRTHPFIGGSQEQVKALLGPPMEREEYLYYSAETFAYLSPDEMAYWIGPQEGFMTFDSVWLILSPGKNGAIQQYRLTHRGIKEVRNPPCEPGTAFMNEVVRVDDHNRRLFVIALADELDSPVRASPRLNLVRAYVSKCRPPWDRRWNASFFTDRELAGYKDEQLPKVLQDGSWAKAYLAEYENETGKLTLHPALPKGQKAFGRVR